MFNKLFFAIFTLSVFVCDTFKPGVINYIVFLRQVGLLLFVVPDTQEYILYNLIVTDNVNRILIFSFLSFSISIFCLYAFGTYMLTLIEFILSTPVQICHANFYKPTLIPTDFNITLSIAHIHMISSIFTFSNLIKFSSFVF